MLRIVGSCEYLPTTWNKLPFPGAPSMRGMLIT